MNETMFNRRAHLVGALIVLLLIAVVWLGMR